MYLNLLQAIPMIGSRPKGQHYLERHCLFSPLCGSILGLVSTTLCPPRDPAPPRATMHRETELPLQSKCSRQWQVKAQINLSQSTGSPLTPISPGASPCDQALSHCHDVLESALTAVC